MKIIANIIYIITVLTLSACVIIQTKQSCQEEEEEVLKEDRKQQTGVTIK